LGRVGVAGAVGHVVFLLALCGFGIVAAVHNYRRRLLV
jgi:hypothetical protein